MTRQNPTDTISTRKRPTLEIRVQLVDGSVETFVQPRQEMAESIWRGINAAQLFTRPRIVIADDYSKSVFVGSRINRIDFIFEGSDFSRIPQDHADLVELSKENFRAHVHLEDPSRLEKRVQSREVGDLMVSFLDLRMQGGGHVYLMNETLIRLPVDNHSFMHRLLAGGSYGIRLQGGGQGFLNLSNLLGYSVYPGVPEIPNDSWIALSSRLATSTE